MQVREFIMFQNGAKESIHENGTYLCAASREQAERAVSYIGDNCRLIETYSIK